MARFRHVQPESEALKLLMVLFMGVVVLTSGAEASGRPNIILLMADDLGWGDPGFNGGTNVQTPQLDAMASAGLKFNRFYAAAPVCSPTRGSCLTGRHPFRYGVRFANGGHMKPEEITLPEILRDAGYATGHFGKWHLGTLSNSYSGKPDRKPEENYVTPGMNGFTEWFSTEFAVATWDPYDPANSHLGKGVAPDTRALYWHNGKNVEGGIEGDDSRILMDQALPFIEHSVAEKKPFFSVIWFHAPHAPVVGGPDYRARYGQYDPEARHYYAAITALDEQVGRLRTALRELQIAENTMVFFCSDNGPEGDVPEKRNVGSAGPFRGRKRSLFEGGVRVPGLLEWPGQVKPGTATDYPAVTSDYLPTILEVLGLSLPDARPIDGISLIPVIRDGLQERPVPIAFETLGQAGSVETRNSPAAALVDNRYKLLTDFTPRGEEDLLFDLQADPGETSNLAASEQPRVAAMKATLSAWRASVTASAAGADYEMNRKK
jgi:arylsulfatase A-like enzyme